MFGPLRKTRSICRGVLVPYQVSFLTEEEKHVIKSILVSSQYLKRNFIWYNALLHPWTPCFFFFRVSYQVSYKGMSNRYGKDRECHLTLIKASEYFTC
jgi:hypothetical protein